MALKHTITADEHAALSDELKKEYKINAQMGYDIDLGDSVFVTDKDPSGLMTALEKEREEVKRVKAVADRLEKEKLDAERSKITDVEELRKSFSEEMAAERKKLQDEQKKIEKERIERQTQSAEALKKQKALEVASELFGTNAPIMLPHIEASLKAVPGDQPTVQIIDATTGQPTIEQDFGKFKENLSTNKMYAPMIVVSNASGGSANGGNSSGIPSATTADGKPKSYSDYSPAELLAIKRENPEQFQKLKSQKG